MFIFIQPSSANVIGMRLPQHRRGKGDMLRVITAVPFTL